MKKNTVFILFLAIVFIACKKKEDVNAPSSNASNKFIPSSEDTIIAGVINDLDSIATVAFASVYIDNKVSGTRTNVSDTMVFTILPNSTKLCDLTPFKTGSNQCVKTYYSLDFSSTKPKWNEGPSFCSGSASYRVNSSSLSE